MVMYCMNQIACFFVYFPRIFVNVDLIVSSLVLNEFVYTVCRIFLFLWVSVLSVPNVAGPHSGAQEGSY